MGKFTEQWAPYIIAVGVVIYLYFAKRNNINNFKDIVTSVINFIAIISGFLTTMLSILMTSSDKAIMIHLKEKEQINKLYLFTTAPIIIGFIDIIFSLLLIPYSECKYLSSLFIFYLFSMLTALFITTSMRAIIVLTMLIYQYNLPKDKKERPINFNNAFKQRSE